MRHIISKWFLFLAALCGVLGFGIGVFQISGSVALTAAVLVGTAAVLLLAFLGTALRLIHNLRSGYSIYQTRSFIALRKTRIKVDNNFEVQIERWRDFVFLEPPKSDELVDMFDTLAGHTFSSADYKSFDSTIAAFTKIKPHIMAVQWSPNKSIIPLIPYRHHTINRSPSLYGPDFLYHAIYFDRATGHSDLKVETPQPIEEVLAFLMPRFRRNVSERVLVTKGLLTRRRNCPQPSLSANRKRISWNLYQPKVGRIYVLLAIYEGERESLLATARSQSLVARIGTKWSRFRGMAAAQPSPGNPDAPSARTGHPPDPLISGAGQS
ncbi:MAG TPA: hypothetical protein VFQ67_14460 [Allosphingosinicella sp.]|nr:hypothetical protein [Allosphingosinicella sp.]